MMISPSRFMAWFKNRSLPLGVFFCLAVSVLLQPAIGSCEEAKSSYEIKAKSPANNGDYVRARSNAVAQAMRMAVDQYLHDALGEEAYERHEKAVRNITQDANRYVRSYRFITVDDNLQSETSEIEVEIGLFADALRKQLSNIGILAAQTPAGAHTVVILIHEKKINANSSTPFWDTKPVSETILEKTFTAAGINVIHRETIRDLVNEETVLRAAKGDIGAAIEIGQKAGADVVIVGNAVASLLDEESKPVQIGMSLKAISSFKAKVVAAKSEFAVKKNPKQSEAEIEGLESVSKKLGEFFLVSVQRFWKPGSLAPSETPSPPARSLEDL